MQLLSLQTREALKHPNEVRSDFGLMLQTMRLSGRSVSDALNQAENMVPLEYDCRDGNASFVEAALQHDRTKSLVFCAACRGDAENYERTGEFVENIMRALLEPDGWWGLLMEPLKMSPSQAITVVNTIVARAAFHRWVDSYDLKHMAKIVSFQQALVPRAAKRFTGAIFISIVQVALFLVAGNMFRKTKSTLLNNAWQTVAQIAESEDARNVLAQATGLTDQEVRRELHRSPQRVSDSVEGRMGEGAQERRYFLVDGIFAAITGKSGREKRKGLGLRRRQPKSTVTAQVRKVDEAS
jgi:hypothetical protein